MNLVLIPNIIYEMTIEDSLDGKVVSTWYTSTIHLTSRTNILNDFMKLMLDDTNDSMVTVYARYLPTGVRIELISSLSYQMGETNFQALEEELRWYQLEGTAVHVGIFDHTKPTHITMLWSRKSMWLWKKADGTVSLLMGNHYYVFLGGKKKQKFLIP